MSPSRHTPSRRDPDPATELAREIARRHSARRKAPLVAAVAAVALGVTVAAATDANAATAHPGYRAAYSGGHGHTLPAASVDPSAGPDVAGPVLALTGRGAAVRPEQGGDERGRDGNAQPGDDRDGQGGDDQGRGAAGPGADRPGGAGQAGAGRGRDGQPGNGGDGAGRDGQGRNDPRANDQGRNDQGRNGQPGNGQGRDDPANNDQGNNDGDNDNGRDLSNTNGLDVLARDCGDSRLTPHTGFQIAPACVDTAFGEVAAADKGPSLLITDAPREARVGESFTLKVSTRNLVRDRFLGAAAGGYYLESSVLTNGGLQRGHFHTACRMLESTREAPESGASPAFFEATQDNGGGAEPDEVSITVKGMPERGTAQCTSWAGDGSHRIPMMQRADQTPAIDSVRVTVR